MMSDISFEDEKLEIDLIDCKMKCATMQGEKSSPQCRLRVEWSCYDNIQTEATL